MINANVLTRVFQISTEKDRGSCFTIDYEGRQYICTAKHVLRHFNGNTVRLFHDGQWKNLEVTLVGHGSQGADISVLAANITLSDHLPAKYTLGGVTLGQELYFLGFPFGITGQGESINRLFPLPFVKKGIISAIVKHENMSVLLIDGHNNPGFSGGPVAFYKDRKELCIGGVVSSYRFDYQDVIDDKGQPTGLRAISNTGIVVAHNIEHAIDAIRDNAVGVPIRGSDQ